MPKISTLASCFKTHGTPEKLKLKIMERVFSLKGDKDGSLQHLPAVMAMIKEAKDRRAVLVGKIEAAGGVVGSGPGSVGENSLISSGNGKAEIPETKIAKSVKNHLKNGVLFTSAQLFKWADAAYGGTQAEGKYTPKDAYDALELGINQHLAGDFSFKSSFPAERIAELEKLLSLVPTQTKRTKEQDDFQQYSTPPTLAYVAGWVANMQENDSFLEPSGGIGGLAVFAKMDGVSDIIVNELSERRRTILKEMGFDKVFGENAEQLNNVLPDTVKPTVIVMNPPFSSTGGRLSQNKTMYGAMHIEQALKRLEPGGRLVAIVGEGMAADKSTFRAWWKKIEKEYSVRANVGMNGEGYRKYGTTFDNQILVIDKTGPTTDNVITGKVDSYDELIPLLREVRDARIPVTQQATDQPTGKGKAEGSGGTIPEHGEAVPANASSVGDGHGETEDKSGDRGPDRADAGMEAGSLDERDNESQPGGRAAGGPERQDAIARETGVDGSRPDREQLPSVDKLETTRKEKSQSSKDSTVEGYQPTVSIAGAKPHPADLVESTAMAAVKLPNITYQPSIAKDIVTSGRLSDVQLEAIAAAGQAHQDTLPNGEQRGFFIGDGTGVGKGREIAGIILDNWNQGRKKAIWISKDRTLAKDAKRDLTGIGLDAKDMIEQGSVKPGAAIPTRDGVLYTAYSTLATVSKKDQLSRLQELLDWAGPDFDGVIVFDESHKMGNAIAIKDGRYTKKPSQMALAAMDLQKALPKAKVVYVSATGATEVSNLAYASRLGLWGDGTAFPNVSSFIGRVSMGGIAAMEVVARDMKAMGCYLARKLAYNGKNKAYQVKYRRLEHALSNSQREIYDELAGAWQTVLANIDEALKLTEADSNGRSHALSAFWGTHQRFFNQVLTAMQMPSVIASIKQDVKDGKAVVLQITNTNEASTNRALANAETESLEDVDITPRDQLMQMIENSFPVQQYEKYEDEDGNTRTRPVLDSNGAPVVNRDAVAQREKLLDTLGGIRVPDAPLDQILNVFGVDNVAEVTGRSKRLVTVDDGSGPKKIRQGWSKTKGVADAAMFMGDKKQILIFSEAGGTGASYHADLAAQNQRQRSHYILQAGWRADSAIQGLGRTHRSNQALAPEYVLVTTDLKGHKRFISSIARKLSQLGALTEGERKASSQGLFTERDNLESEYAADAVTKLIHKVNRDEVPGLDMTILAQELGLPKLMDEHGRLNEGQIPTVPRFLNRILSMKIDMQDKVFDLFSDILDANVSRAEENGTLDTGLETLQAKGIRVVGSQPVYTDKKSGAVTEYVQLDVDYPVEKRPYDTKSQTVVNKQSGRPWQIVAEKNVTTEGGEVVDSFVLKNGRGSARTIAKSEFAEKFSTITDKKEARAAWNAELKEIPDTMTQREHLITGALLPIWDKLKGHPRIVRVQAGNETMLGRIIPGENISEVMALLDVEGKAVDMTPEQVQTTVLDNGQTVTLDNGWKIVAKQVAGDKRMEVTGVEYSDYSTLSRYGAFTERINYVTRVFIPVGEVGKKVLGQMLDGRKILTVTGKTFNQATLSSSENGDNLGLNDNEPLYTKGADYEKRDETLTEEQQENSDRAGSAAVAFVRGLPVTILGNRIAKDFQDQSKTDLLGQEVTGVDDVALIGQIYRNPHFETNRFIFVKNGRVVGVTGVTSRLPASTAMFTGDITTIDEAVVKIKDLVAKAGADGFYILHNHPSGNPTPSKQDRSITAKIAARTDGSFLGHVIINHDTYATLTKSGVEVKNLPDSASKAKGQYVTGQNPIIENPVLGMEIGSSSDLAIIAAKLQNESSFQIIGTSGQEGAVSGIMDVPVSSAMFASPLKQAVILRRFMKSTGSGHLFAVNVPTGSGIDFSRAIVNNLLIDVRYENGKTLQSKVTRTPGVVAGRSQEKAFVVEEDGPQVSIADETADTPLSVDALQNIATTVGKAIKKGSMRTAKVKGTGFSDAYEDMETLSKIIPGQIVELVREPSNQFDENAISVQIDGKHIGYIAKEKAKDYAPRLDAGEDLTAVIANVFGKPARPTFNVKIGTAGETAAFQPKELKNSAKDIEKELQDTLGSDIAEDIKKNGLTPEKEGNFFNDVIDEPPPPITKQIISQLKALPKAIGRRLLGALTLRQLREIYGKRMKPVADYYKATQGIDADSNRVMGQAEEIYSKWEKLDNKSSDSVAALMSDATFAGVDPSKDFQPRADFKTLQNKMKENADDILTLRAGTDPKKDAKIANLQTKIKEERKRIVEERKRRIAYNELSAKYQALPQAAKDVYQAVRDSYTGNLTELRQALMDRMERTMPTAKSKEDAIEAVRLKFDQYLKEGPYFPLARFGDYVVVLTDGEEREVHSFDYMGERNRFIADAQKGGKWTVKTMTAKEYSPQADGASIQFVQEVIRSINKSGEMSEAEKNSIIDEVNQLFIKTMPDLSHRKHFAHRKKVVGYSRDQLRAFATNMQHAAHHIARINHADKMTKAVTDLDEMAREATEGDVSDITDMRNELTKRNEQILNPNISPIAQALTSLGFVFNIGPSIASALVNMSQTPMVSFPMLGARHGARIAANALSKSSAQYFSSPWNKERGFDMTGSAKLSQDEKDMLQNLIADGTIDVSLARSLAQATGPDALNFARTKHGHVMLKVMRAVSWPFHVTELANRQITVLAAYRLARAENKSNAEATLHAKEIVMDSHFDYSAANRARFMEGNVQRVLFLFKQYSQQMTFLLARSFQQSIKGETPEVKRIARQQLSMIIGGHFLVSGLFGMPVLGSIASIMQFFAGAFGDDDDPWDWEDELRKMLADSLGKDAGEAIVHGPWRLIPGLGAFDISSRVSLGDLWLRSDDRETEGKDTWNKYLNMFLGPLASNGAAMAQGLSAMSEGKFERGLEMMLPKAIKDGMKSIRYGREGVTSWNDATLMQDMSAIELAGQALGFTPSRVSEMYEGKSAIKGRETRLLGRRESLINQWISATKDGDSVLAQRILQKQMEFSQKNPAFRITPKTLRMSSKNREKVQAQTKQGVYLPKTRQGLLEEGRFANTDDE